MDGVSPDVELLRAEYDIARDVWLFRDGRASYQWQTELPFPLKEIDGVKYAERATVVKYAEDRLNGNTQFIPAWAEDVLGKSDLTRQRESAMELAMLRAFFAAWEHLHSIPNKPENRRKSEAAAAALVDAAHAIRTLRAPATVERIVNGG